MTADIVLKRRAVFLDRDGTLNVEKSYLHRYSDWEWIPGAIEAIKTFNRAGFLVVVVTNQAGIARGHYGENEVRELHARISQDVAEVGGRIDAIYFCPHHTDFGPERNCECRKPRPGMLLQAQKDLDIDMASSYMIGDKALDVAAGLSAGVQPILVLTGYGKEERCLLAEGSICAESIVDASAWVVSNARAFQHFPAGEASR